MTAGEASVDVGAGARLRALRTAKRMSRGDLGNEVGVGYQQVERYEKGKAPIPAGVAVRLAKIFDVTTDDLLVGDTTGKL